MQREHAEEVALMALAFVAGSDDLGPVFLGATGASAEDLRQRTAEPDLLAAVLDFLAMNDAWVIEFCDAAGLDYALPMAARTALSGGAETHWT